MPPSNFRDYVDSFARGLAAWYEGDEARGSAVKFYGLDQAPAIEPAAWTKWAQTLSESAISLEDFNIAVKEIEAFIKDGNKEVENMPEVSWEEMMQIKTEEQNND